MLLIRFIHWEKWEGRICGFSGLFADFEIENPEIKFVCPFISWIVALIVSLLYYIHLLYYVHFRISFLYLSFSRLFYSHNQQRSRTHARAARAHTTRSVCTRGGRRDFCLSGTMYSPRARIRESCGKAFTRFDHVRRRRPRQVETRGRNGHLKKRIAPPPLLI